MVGAKLCMAAASQEQDWTPIVLLGEHCMSHTLRITTLDMHM